MRRLIVGLFFTTILLAACGPAATPAPPADTDNLDAFVSQGEPLVAEIVGREVTFLFEQEQGIDTSDVVVTLVNFDYAIGYLAG